MRERKYIPIQIIGTQRSGSNLLRLMINELDGVIAPHPPHILKTFTPLLSQYPDLTRENNFRLLVDDVCKLVETNPVVWEHIVLDRNRVLNLCEHNTLVELFRVIYDLMAEANHATHWVCKSMANVKFAQDIEADKIKPFYIHLLRDGRDVAASFKKVAVGEKHVYHLAKYWKNLQSLSVSLVEKVGAERAITIKYEDLIHHPEKTMANVCDLVGLPYSSNVLNYFDSDESKHTADSGFMWENLRKPILRNNTQKYKQSLTNEEIDLFENVAGDLLEKFNYQIVGKELLNEISATDVIRFDLENESQKKAILRKEHLKIDLFKRREQEDCIKSIKERLASGTHKCA